MSNQREREDIRKALQAKGFLEENNDHYFYTLIVDDKETAIFTKVSKGKKYKTIQQKLLSKMSKQLKLTNSQFLKIIDCELQYEDYLRILMENKII